MESKDEDDYTFLAFFLPARRFVVRPTSKLRQQQASKRKQATSK